MGRQVRTVTVSLPPDLARQVDHLAEREGRTRSELFRAAIRRYLDERRRWDELSALTRARVKELGVTEDEILDAIVEERRKRRRWKPEDYKAQGS